MAYRVQATLTNPTASPITAVIYAGTIFQVTNPFARVQNLATTTPITVIVPATGSTVVTIPSWCLNKSFSPPSATPMSVTPFATARDYASQNDAWDDMSRRR